MVLNVVSETNSHKLIRQLSKQFLKDQTRFLLKHRHNGIMI